MTPILKTLSETRQWIAELRRWGSLLRPAVTGAVRKGRLQAQARRMTEGGPGAEAIAAICGLGFKRELATIAVREALAECGEDAGSETLVRDALRRIR